MSAAAPLTQGQVTALAVELVGPMIIGTVLNVVLFGMMLMQVQTYFRNSKNDPQWMKWMVGVLLLIDTLNTVAAAVVSYDYSVTDFGRVDKILVISPIFGVMVLTTAIIESMVQAFFALRVKWLTGKTWLAGLILLSALLQTFCGIGTVVGGFIKVIFPKLLELKAIIIVWLVLAPVTDIVISGTLVIYLRSHRTGFEETDDLLSKLTRVTIQTGVITAVWAVIDLIVFLAIPTNLHFVFNIPLAKLYGNCLMSSLNARTRWSEDASRNGARHWTENSMQKPAIQVTTTTGVHNDFEMSSAARYPVGVQRDVIDIRTKGNALDVKKVADDGLSLRSETSDEDAFDRRARRLAGRENDGSKVDVTNWRNVV